MADAETRKLEAKIKKKEQDSGESTEEQKEKDVGKADAKSGSDERSKNKRGELKSENIIRMAETNLDGNKKVVNAIRRIRGISFMMSNAISKISGLGDKKLGDLSDSERGKLEEMIMHSEKHGIPDWMINRRNDPETGENRHIAVSELEFIKKMDIDQMRKLKTYKGIRHSSGLPVRGQRTRGSFRKNSSVGVSKKKEAPAKKKNN